MRPVCVYSNLCGEVLIDAFMLLVLPLLHQCPWNTLGLDHVYSSAVKLVASDHNPVHFHSLTPRLPAKTPTILMPTHHFAQVA